MIKFYTYLYYRILKREEDKITSLMKVFVFFVFHILSIHGFILGIFNLDAGSWRTGYPFMDRFVLIPLFLSPFAIAFYIIIKLNRAKINAYLEVFQLEDDATRKRKGRILIIYTVITVLITFLSVFSSELCLVC